MVGKFEGILVGYKTYDKAVDKSGTKLSVEHHVYSVFCEGCKKDAKTGLFKDDCKVVSIVEEEQVLKNLQYGMRVEFYGEAMSFKGKDGTEKSYMQFSGITAVNK